MAQHRGEGSGRGRQKDQNRVRRRNQVLSGIDVVMGGADVGACAVAEAVVDAGAHTGAEADVDVSRALAGKRLGLITNPTGVTKSLEATLDVLHRDRGSAGGFRPGARPQGDAQDAPHVGDFRDESTGVMVQPIRRTVGHCRPCRCGCADLYIGRGVFDTGHIGNAIVMRMPALGKFIARRQPISGSREGGT